MLNIPSAIDIYICTQPTDMRKSFDGLSICVSKIVVVMGIWKKPKF